MGEIAAAAKEQARRTEQVGKKSCAKCDKKIGWLSQEKIDGANYCVDCYNQLKKEKKEHDGQLKKEKREHGGELKEENKKHDDTLEREIEKCSSDIGWTMNKKQRFVLFVTAAILILMLLFPPIKYVNKGLEISMGYAFILTPPISSIESLESNSVPIINVALLSVQYLFSVTIGVILWFAFKKN